MRIAVIIPALNEEARIGEQLDAVNAIQGLHEIIVVDGGSSDRTLHIAEAHRGVKVISAGRGRALQMNAGAAIATGDVLLFLHADVGLPEDAARWIAAALEEPLVVAGAFRTRTVCDTPQPWFGPLLHLADLRSRYTSLPYGDQALFVRAGVFERLGGFADQQLMEDLDLSRRLHSVGKICIVPASVRVSARRFLARPAYYALVMNVFPLLYRLGIPPRVLARFYGDPR